MASMENAPPPFRRFYSASVLGQLAMSSGGRRPSVEVSNGDTEISVTAEIPGLEEK